MKRFNILLAALVAMTFMVSSAPAFAEFEWSSTLQDEPPTGHSAVTVFRRADVFLFYKKGTGTDPSEESNWLILGPHANVDICFDNDTILRATNTSTASVKILHVPHGNFGVTPSETLEGQPLLGITLDGTATQGGSTQDCIYDVKGPMWIRVIGAAEDASQNGLVSVSARKF